MKSYLTLTMNVPYLDKPSTTGLSAREVEDLLFDWDSENKRRKWHNDQGDAYKALVPFDMRPYAERRADFLPARMLLAIRKEGGDNSEIRGASDEPRTK